MVGKEPGEGSTKVDVPGGVDRVFTGLATMAEQRHLAVSVVKWDLPPEKAGQLRATLPPVLATLLIS
jgi:hypothetical protein